MGSADGIENVEMALSSVSGFIILPFSSIHAKLTGGGKMESFRVQKMIPEAHGQLEVRREALNQLPQSLEHWIDCILQEPE